MRFFLAALAVGAVAAPIGCTSLLGDFKQGSSSGEGGITDDGGVSGDDVSSNSDGPGGSSDAPSDSTMKGTDGDAPSTGPADAHQEAEAGVTLSRLRCNSFGMQNPLLIATVPAPEGGGGGGNGSPFNSFTVEHIGQNTARLFVSSYGSNSSSQNIYTVSEGSTGSVTGTITLDNQNIQGLLKTSNATAMLVESSSSGGYTMYSLADSDPGTSSSALVAQATVGSIPNQASGSSGRQEFDFTALSGGGYYVLSTYTTSTSTFDVASWLTGNATWGLNISNASMQSAFGSPLVQDPGTANVYGFFAPPGMGGGAPTAINQYTFVTAVAQAPTSRSLMASGSTNTAATAAVAAHPGGGYDLAFVELGRAQLADVRVGTVAEANIDSFLLDDLPMLDFDVQSDAGFFDTTPFGNANGLAAHWMNISGVGTEFGALGTGGTGGSVGTYTGLNFYVSASNGQWLIEEAGSGQNLLAGKTIYGAAFDLAQGINYLLRTYDIAWVEKNSDGSFSLYFNLVDCSP